MPNAKKFRFAGRRDSIILFTAFFIVSSGAFLGCEEFWYGLVMRATHAAYGNLFTPGDDSQQVPYGITVGYGGAIYTREGGPAEPWIEGTSPTSEDLNYVKVYRDSTVAAAVGNSGTVIRSTDGGVNWEDVSIPSVTTNLHGLDFLYYWPDDLFVVVCGDNGSVYRSTDSGGGWTWEELNTPTSENLKSIGAITTAIFIAVGENGTIIRTGDSGQTWDDISVADPTADFNRLLISTFYPNFNRAWAVGDNGTIYASTDYGNSWFAQNSGTVHNFRDLAFRNSNEGIAAGENGTVRHTTDGGSTWLEDAYLGGLTDHHYLSVSGVDSVTASALVVSSLGGEAVMAETTFVLTVSSEPIVGIGDEPLSLPVTCGILQNYPNPFNPTTTLPVEIAGNTGSNQHVRLTIHDLRGRQVRTLVDADLQPGVHQIHWDGRDDRGETVSSGTYLYRLRSGVEMYTRKMTVLK